MLLKNPGFTAIAIIALALGIGANTAIFSVVSAVLLRPLPYPEPEQIAAVWAADATKPDSQTTFSYPDFADLRAQNQVFSSLGAYRTENFAITESGGPAAHAQGAMVTADVLSLLRVNPVLGRAFTADDDKPGARNVILSYELWQRRFGGDRKVLERTVMLDGVAYQVIGIMPEGFRFPIQNKPVEFWISFATQFEAAPGQEQNTTPSAQRGMHYLKAVARLKPGVTPEQAQANAKAVMTALAQQYPDTNKSFNSAKVNPLLADITADVKPALLVLLGAAACVLLIACVNVANLLLARATSRQKEIGIRAALGASRIRILRQLLTESGVLALAGGIAGMLLATWGTAALASMLPRNFPRAAEIDPTCACSRSPRREPRDGVLFGMAPAWRVSRPDVVTATE
jgi:putative ABC transport system permease protein